MNKKKQGKTTKIIKNIKVKPKKSSAIDLIHGEEIHQDQDEKLEIFDIESQLHYLMVRMNHLESIKYDFNIIFSYHKIKLLVQTVSTTDFEKIKAVTSEILEFERTYPFIKEWYFICYEFLNLIRDLTIYHEMLDKDCFDYKKEFKKNKEKILQYYRKDEFNNNKFHFSTFYITSKSNDSLMINFSNDLIEKSMILQNKFLHIIFLFFEYYPLPKSIKEIEQYYDFLFRQNKKDDEKNKENNESEEKKSSVDSNRSRNFENRKESENTPIELNNDLVKSNLLSKSSSESKSFYEMILSCCRKAKPLDLRQFQHFTRPLLSLEFTGKNDNFIQIIKMNVYEFSRIYLRIEEMIYKEISNS